jgi:WD40 repeat protein
MMKLPHPVADLALSSDARMLAVAAGSDVVIVDVATGRPRARYACPTAVNGLAFDSAARRVAAACDDAQVVIHGIDGPGGPQTLTGDRGGFATVSWSPDGALLAAGHHEPWVSVFDVASAAPLAVLDPEVFDDEGRTKVRFLSDDRLLSTAFDTVAVWRAAVRGGWERPSRRTLHGKGDVHHVDMDLSSDGARIASIAELEGQSGLQVWPLTARGKGFWTPVEGYSQRLAWLGDRRIAVSVADHGRVDVFVVGDRSARPADRWTLPEHGPGPMAYASELRRLFVGAESGDVWAIDCDSGRLIDFQG